MNEPEIPIGTEIVDEPDVRAGEDLYVSASNYERLTRKTDSGRKIGTVSKITGGKIYLHLHRPSPGETSLPPAPETRADLVPIGLARKDTA